MSDELVHHGVKGMKWGVQNYKEIRSGAKVFQKTKDVQSKQKYQAEQQASTAIAKLKSKERTKNAATHEANITGSKRSGKKVTREIKRYEKQLGKTNKAIENRRIKSSAYNKADYRYQQAVNKAAKLPINIKYRPRTARAKGYIATGFKDLAIKAGVSAIAVRSGVDIPTINTGVTYRKTRNDRFAESVRSAQIRNVKKSS